MFDYSRSVLQSYVDRYYDAHGTMPPMPTDEMTGKDVEAGDDYIITGSEDINEASFFSAYEIDKAEKALKDGNKARALSDDALYKIGEVLSEMKDELARANRMVC